MKTLPRLAALLASLVALPLLAAPKVTVSFTEPEKFIDIQADALDAGASRPAMLKQLEASFRETLAAQLKDGWDLRVNFTNIDLAGDFRHGAQIGTERVRLVNEHYAPHLAFAFSLVNAAGQTVASGARELTNAGFLDSAPLGRDAFRYEDQLLQDWARKELKPLLN